MDWFRWHHGTVNDPKWRVIARKSRQPLHAVLAVWCAMLERASQSDPRGTLAGWDPEDIGAALDMDPADVTAVYEAMQGKVLDGDTLTGWDKRQPKRERETPDNSADRVRLHRERQKQARNGNEDRVTPCNAGNGLEERREEEITEATASEGERGSAPPPAQQGTLLVLPIPKARTPDAKGTRLPDDWELPDDWRAWAEAQGLDPPTVGREADKFRDFWRGKPGKDGRKSDWAGTWRNWIRRKLEDGHGRQQPQQHHPDALKQAVLAGLSRRMAHP